jgi:beta-N-acetylhexosaminidase
MLLAGCHGDDKKSPKPSATATTTAEATATPTPGPPPVPEAAAAKARKLPLGQRVGQLFVVGFDGVDLQADVFEELRGHGWGGIYVGPQNAFDLAGAGLFAGEAVVVARKAKRVPPLVASFDDARPERLGSNRREAKARATVAAADAKAQGVTLTTAPLLDVGLGDDAEQIAKAAPAAVQAWVDGGVASAPAHFPGQGTATQDPIDGPANVGLPPKNLRSRDLKPWRSALRRAPAVTVSSATFTAYDVLTPAALTPAIVEGLLRRDLRFGGVAMTDDLSGIVAQTGGSPTRAAIRAIRTGIDVVFVPDPDQRTKVYKAVLEAARKGDIPAARINEAAARVLALKADL